MSPLLLVALVLAGKPIDPLAVGASVQITGWSADATRFSVRSIEVWEPDEGMPRLPSCPGYVDHEGKKFNGRLVLAAYEQGKLTQSWVVQDYPDCTAPKQAKATLDAAKAKLAKLGIDLNAKGTTVTCDGTCELGGGAQLELENTTRVDTRDDDDEGLIKGTLRATLISGATRTRLWEKNVSERFTRMMGGNKKAGFAPVEVAPGGKAFLLRAYITFTSGRGGSTVYIPAGLHQIVPANTGG